MRVFDRYRFNIADKVSFKNTKPYLENMLAELGCSYKRLAFELNCAGSNIYPLLCSIMEKYPSLKKYYRFEDYSERYRAPYYYIGSFTEKWYEGELYADKEDWDDIAAVFSKIPRPYNLPFGGMVLSGINWYDNSDDTDMIDYYRMKTHSRYPLAKYTPFRGNSIVHIRNFDDGRKRNIVFVHVEATANPEPRDTKDILEKLVPYLGEPFYSYRECLFDMDDTKRLDDLQKIHSKRMAEMMRSSLPVPRDDWWREAQKHPHISVSDPPIPHVADKFTLNKAFAKTGFERQKGEPNWLHRYSCIDAHGFLYDAYTQKLTNCNMFRVWVEIYGYNFKVGYNTTQMKDYYVSEEGESLDILREFAEFCVKLRDEYSAELARDFGDTPSWYWQFR